ncbi:gliding motility-associated C-terminal domain-containing protein [Flagellimonas flava]|uniref:Gliding motility-associated C-terminal domain-containing protein n=1 Tax=Flagellimonas flava TaxID=570519 RepID=A0A1M5Q9M5_9FLAO|nr:gliding motility-associated C-terminal domain-containing protein [Allomuricauda flava]SHH10722.1 gliding motility-associated C-terminal domain-containing protein [Allomuricauda flava]
MKKILFSIFYVALTWCNAQTAMYNSGSLQIHSQGQIGFHTDFINDTTFDQNEGLAGFYGNNLLQVQGSIAPTFWDLEFMVPNNVFLQNTVNVRNNTNFVDGNVLTPTNDQTIYLNFLQNGFFNGDSDASKVTGFAAINDRGFFSFPVGDQTQLRPLLLDSEGSTPLAICAYFFENPSSPSSISESFNVNEKVRDIGTVSDREFWIVQSEIPATVTISWNSRSAIGAIPNATLESVIVVGWSKAANQWVVIGNTAQSGDLTNGFITSQAFIPNDFSAITFGTIPLPTDTFAVNNPTLGNYFISPNGDGTNDFLVFDNLSESPNNSVLIFNRFGQKVFEQLDYVDEFNGASNTGNFYLSQDIGLSEGIYYYLVTLNDLELEYQGFIFLDR